ncbi:HEAT repeat protein, partial [Aspergillus sclerotialis]
MSEFRKESTVLFVEEKQNLFINEIREVDVWIKSLFHLTETAYDGSSIAELCGWVSEGLSYLYGFADGNVEMDGPLGWTTKPETFTLGMRVISLALALASKDFPASK